MGCFNDCGECKIYGCKHNTKDVTIEDCMWCESLGCGQSGAMVDDPTVPVYCEIYDCGKQQLDKQY